MRMVKVHGHQPEVVTVPVEKSLPYTYGSDRKIVHPHQSLGPSACDAAAPEAPAAITNPTIGRWLRDLDLLCSTPARLGSLCTSS